MTEQAEPKTTIPYLIDTVMRDGSYHHFPPRVLDVLINKDHVLRFKRTSGWVTVGADPVRAKPGEGYCPVYFGPERRLSGGHDPSRLH